MLRILFTLIFCLVAFGIQAQVTYSPMNVKSFDEAPFSFNGKRVMMGDRVDNPNSKNIFLFTKTDSGAIPDTMFIHQFEKIDDTWHLKKDTTITSTQTISFWGNRKAFTTNKENGELLAYFTYCTGNVEQNIVAEVFLIAFYQGKLYTLSESKNKSTKESDNFGELPDSVKSQIIDYWNKLDRWK